ncbi:MAG: hypothetical protein GY720_09945, partial [bacterium]|nr:hypothetical protein [bacterium]
MSATEILALPMSESNGSVNSSTYDGTMTKYDVSQNDSSQWKLKTGIQSSKEIRLQAACDGYVSAVPQNEFLPFYESTNKLLKRRERWNPQFPDRVTLFLDPGLRDDPDQQSPFSIDLFHRPLWQAFDLLTVNAGFGRIKYLVYENVDPLSLIDSTQSEDSDKSLDFLNQLRANETLRDNTVFKKVDGKDKPKAGIASCCSKNGQDYTWPSPDTDLKAPGDETPAAGYAAESDAKEACEKAGGEWNADKRRLDIFLGGESRVYLNKGDSLGKAAKAGTSKYYELRFGIVTETGYIDPIALFDVAGISAFFSSKPNQATSDFKNLVGTNDHFKTIISSNPVQDGKIASGNAVAQRILPYPILFESKKRLSITDTDWAIIKTTQKGIYWGQITRSSYVTEMGGTQPSGLKFKFNNNDMSNPFQLETIVEFYAHWQNKLEAIATKTYGGPADVDSDSASHPDSALPSQEEVDFSDDDHPFQIILLDPFQHTALGDPETINPDFVFDRFPRKRGAAYKGALRKGKLNDPDDSESTYYPCVDSANNVAEMCRDEYGGILFIVHKGEVADWWRWNSFATRMHETKEYKAAHDWRVSSIRGNRKFTCNSYVSQNYNDAGTEVTGALLNFVFKLREVGHTGGKDCSARFYNRHKPPVAATKDGIAIHWGKYRNVDHGVDNLKSNNYSYISATNSGGVYNWSGGCQTSPQYNLFRDSMIRLRNKDRSSVEVSGSDFYFDAANDSIHKISGDLDEFKAGERIEITGTEKNNSSYRIESVESTKIVTVHINASDGSHHSV